MRVLLVKLSALGDIVHAFPAVEEAKEHLPGVEIDWLVDAAHLELVRRHGGASLRLLCLLLDTMELFLLIFPVVQLRA